ncbi:25S rRNA (cytosine-C(5))-methyltransferase rcm1 [Cytospora mali]|uniref:25S rRNA (Cytosine-C(5))-methyltransferase rcm1 n=1 Tax=Cytospora mali TaxID=578113 RepID=A0A194VG83_CYTMA|nr:25S rRNA (cytosine-C(5))-methyltransferase rcm1 [Valsa mali var. pyri (nom. inval.)]
MSLYHEAASVLDAGQTPSGNLRSRVFNNKDLKSPPSQVYALALETCKWSSVLAEVIDQTQLLKHERKLTPVLSLLLVHDFLLAKGGIALPASHGLRAAIERHKSRLTAEFTRARLRRKCPSIDALKEHIEASVYANSQHPRWIRVNSLKTTLEDQLATTFQGHQRVDSVQKVLTDGSGKHIYIDAHIPNLVAVSPRFNFAKCTAYKSGEIILQDKASCFPAYLLDPQPLDGDVIDGCAAPGNKTTHLAAIISSRSQGISQAQPSIYAIEKDTKRAKTLEKMVKIAGSDGFTHINQGRDFLKVDPSDKTFSKVGALLLDPSCSGSGIVGRDDMPELHLPAAGGTKPASKTSKNTEESSKKRKRPDDDQDPERVLIDDDGNTTIATSDKDLKTRLEALSSFQLTLLLHAFEFPAARRVTYSTCSVHAEENEQVVLNALQSDVAQRRGWRVLSRDAQVSGMKAWSVRGQVEACDGDSQIAESCIRAYKDDGRGVMGFFVAAFVRSEDADASLPTGLAIHEHKKKMVSRGKQKGSKQAGPSSPKVPDASGNGDNSADGSDDGSDWSGFDD